MSDSEGNVLQVDLPINDHSEALAKQNTRLMPVFKVEKFKKEAKKHWDLFYKRNESRFFKVRIYSKL